jgi:hypothetical protein
MFFRNCRPPGWQARLSVLAAHTSKVISPSLEDYEAKIALVTAAVA